MKITILTVLALLGCTKGSTTQNLFSDEHIEYINSKAITWEAGRNFPEGTTLAELKSLLGAKKMSLPFLKLKLREGIKGDDIPESFDARQHWSNCRSISEIRDQSYCGSCWAVATTSVMSDRICIKSNGQKQTRISSIDLMSCCKKCGNGCSGGSPASALDYWMENGIVTGGEYGSGMGCKPYPFPQCRKPLYPPCPDVYYKAPACARKCSNESISYNQDLHKAESVYLVPNDELEIRKEILTNGPVEASFDVYTDFYSYKSGVYQRTEHLSDREGTHSVRVIGWGVEKGLPYWLVTNSWNEGWGEKGLFKIRRGNDECSIEDEVLGAIPKNE